VPEHGFKRVLHLSEKQKYRGRADIVMLVWHDTQIVPAECYRKAQFPKKKVDIAICENPNTQKEHLGDRGLIYHFSGNSSGGGGGSK
jgi:hypothetical protein